MRDDLWSPMSGDTSLVKQYMAVPLPSLLWGVERERREGEGGGEEGGYVYLFLEGFAFVYDFPPRGRTWITCSKAELFFPSSFVNGTIEKYRPSLQTSPRLHSSITAAATTLQLTLLICKIQAHLLGCVLHRRDRHPEGRCPSARLQSLQRLQRSAPRLHTLPCPLRRSAWFSLMF